jgi:hypothetical protein
MLIVFRSFVEIYGITVLMLGQLITTRYHAIANIVTTNIQYDCAYRLYVLKNSLSMYYGHTHWVKHTEIKNSKEEWQTTLFIFKIQKETGKRRKLHIVESQNI